MHDHEPILEGRLTRHLTERILPAATEHVADLQVRIHRVADAADSPSPDAVPGVAGQGEPIGFAQALAAHYEPLRVGEPWGSAWGTSWLQLEADLSHLRGEPLEVQLELGWKRHSPGFQAEGLVFRPDGGIIKALNPFNSWIPAETDEQGRFHVLVEAAANPILLDVPPFVPTEQGDKLTAGPAPIYTLARAEVVRVHQQVRELAADLACLDGLARQLPEDSSRRWQLRVGIDHALDLVDLDDVPGTARAARAVLAPLLEAPAAASAHQLTAIGHAHIDSAWLWPLRETRRKVARTLANQLNLMAEHPEHRFVLPAAQHARWVEQDHPELFARVRRAVDEGRIIPIGGMWVESDANLPGGEAFCRQLVEGVRYFEQALGRRCHEVWLPDSFGYSAALPQLARLAGARWFLTQKISWNQVDDFPHHSFWWEGIDGSRIFTHFPPADTYNSDLSARETAHAERNFRDKGHANSSLVPFGWGDGGGGPTREMLAQARRTENLEGSPRVRIEEPDAFFERARGEHQDPAVWSGELYLELHRATFTTQHRVKQANRAAEHLLRTAEWWCTTAAARGLMDYPHEQLREAWRTVLLCQFHDILPGTSISWVYRDVLARQAEVAEALHRLVDQALSALTGGTPGAGELLCNASPVVIDGVAPGAVAPAVVDGSASPRLEELADGWLLVNDHLRVELDADGLVRSLRDLAADREVIPAGARGNLLQLHQDFPNMWDAWDVDPFYRNQVVDLTEADEVSAESDDETVRITVRRHSPRRGGHGSTMVQTLELGRGRGLRVLVDVDWDEKDRFLKLAWPVDVHSDSARFEVQMGHVTRPVHTNTSWDHSRFEVNAHRWVQLCEPGYGVGMANASTYGWDVTRHGHGEREAGTHQVLRASLLRGPAYPDPRTDRGEYHFEFELLPGAELPETIAAGYRMNMPRLSSGGAGVEPLVSLDEGGLVEALKLADDGSGDVVVRLYEPLGQRARTRLHTSFALAEAYETDLLEERLGDESVVAPSAVTGVEERSVGLQLRPFQVVTLRLRGRR
ncbi:alpha-mannosidase [Luteococcus peritonei]|uniref:Alpha-mannosidase n=1 Tax=Luteococcus peritonei TaxID=88874 RepID=A0ABW4RWA6_9ACTN